MNWLKRFWSCRVRGVHVWSKPWHTMLPPNEGKYVKQCRHCGSVRAVKRRSAKKETI